MGLDSDITWFGQRSIDPATLTLKEAGQYSSRLLPQFNHQPGFKEDTVNFLTNTMWNNIRLPFSNNWRVGPVSADCYPCTVPASSGK